MQFLMQVCLLRDITKYPVIYHCQVYMSECNVVHHFREIFSCFEIKIICKVKSVWRLVCGLFENEVWLTWKWGQFHNYNQPYIFCDFEIFFFSSWYSILRRHHMYHCGLIYTYRAGHRTHIIMIITSSSSSHRSSNNWSSTSIFYILQKCKTQ